MLAAIGNVGLHRSVRSPPRAMRFLSFYRRNTSRPLFCSNTRYVLYTRMCIYYDHSHTTHKNINNRQRERVDPVDAKADSALEVGGVAKAQGDPPGQGDEALPRPPEESAAKLGEGGGEAEGGGVGEAKQAPLEAVRKEREPCMHGCMHEDRDA